MLRFECDYAEGCIPEILEAITRENYTQLPGYSEDIICDRARNRIREACACRDADVHFLVGGTQANTIAIAACLRPHQGVLSVDAGHINCHESGAVEATGHKVLALPSPNGHLSADQIRQVCSAHFTNATFEHMVQPAMVYITQPAENGSLYSLQELEEIRKACDEWNLLLFCDGARLGYGLGSPVNDVSLADLARLTDLFYIGGTKVGALFGEALVITHPAAKKDFRYILKQKGGMLAKGWLLGIQFDVLMEDNRIVKLGKHAVEQALRIRKAFEEKNIPFLMESWTNQQFPILTKEQLKLFDDKFAYCVWEPIDAQRDAVRFCTSWATTAEQVDQLVAYIGQAL